MTSTVENLVLTIGLFIGLLSAYGAFFQVAHSRHHELSALTVSLRADLRKKIEEFGKAHGSGGGEEVAGDRAKLAEEVSSYDMIYKRYIWATRGINWIAGGTVLALVIGMVLAGYFAYEYQHSCWIFALIAAVIPGLIGMVFILWGDLWKAKKCNDVFNKNFIEFCEDEGVARRG